jgi:hypothetical protein
MMDNNMPSIEYDELRPLMRSSNSEIKVLAEILDNVKDRLEALEKRQVEILDEIHKLKHPVHKSKS